MSKEVRRGIGRRSSSVEPAGGGGERTEESANVLILPGQVSGQPCARSMKGARSFRVRFRGVNRRQALSWRVAPQRT